MSTSIPYDYDEDRRSSRHWLWEGWARERTGGPVSTDTIDPDYDEMRAEAVPRGDVVACDFSTALALLKAGHCVSRLGWNGPGQWIHLQVPDRGSYMTEPYLYIKNTQGGRIPWLASQGDLLSSDWFVVEGVREEVA